MILLLENLEIQKKPIVFSFLEKSKKPLCFLDVSRKAGKTKKNNRFFWIFKIFQKQNH